MRAGEIITHVTLPLLPQNTKSLYLKRRDRASYEFALASAAVVIEMAGRFAGHRLHWVVSGRSRGDHRRRNTLWQDLIPVNRPFGERLRRLRGAKPQRDNAFKVELAKRTLIRALQTSSSREGRIPSKRSFSTRTHGEARDERSKNPSRNSGCI